MDCTELPSRKVYQRLGAVLLLYAGAVFAGCGSALGPDDLVGVYQASRVVATGADAADFLAEGGSLSITLSHGGVTSGTFVIPASLSESGTVETLDLTGTYTFEDNIVRFEHSADTFIRDLDWTYSENILQATGTFDGTTIEAVLIRLTTVPEN